jgi:ABC-2 type transport system permease protein
MLNIIRSDIYRIIRCKSLYITFVLYLVLTSLQTVFPGEVFIGISTVNIPGLEIIPDKISGILSPFVTMSYSDNIIYFMLAIIFALTSTDFSSGAVKNTLSNGVSRIKFYFSKLILASLFCTLMFIGGIIVSASISTAVNGFGGAVTGEYLLSVLRSFAVQLLMLFAAVCIGMAIIFITKKGAALNAIYIFFFLGLTAIIFLAMRIFEKLNTLIKYDFISNLKILSNVDLIPSADTARALILGIVYIVTSTVLGIIIFQKSEIK